MYFGLLIVHNVLRWVALAGLLLAIYRAARGHTGGKPFTAVDNSFRHWTTTIVQVQLTIGFILYFQSPFVASYWASTNADGDGSGFFALVHLVMMFAAVTILSIGSAIAKRKMADRDKFRTMLTWFTVAFLIIIIAIPWPFSPLAQRPYLRIS